MEGDLSDSVAEQALDQRAAADGRLDLVIRGGHVVSGRQSSDCDVGVRNGRIVALGEGLRGEREIDARGKLVLPGGVEAHCHIDQESSLGGVRTADDFFTATRSAAFGGNTTVIPFACQARGDSLEQVVGDYLARAQRGAVIDYTFHLLVTDPTDRVLEQELPRLLRSGYGSVKLFMAYERFEVTDHQMLEVMAVARRHGALVMVHAENAAIIRWATEKLRREGKTQASHHAASHPPLAEIEAIQRVVTLSEVAQVPVLVVHVSTEAGMETIRRTRQRGVEVYAETCPQYLLLTADELDSAGAEAAKWCCSPPLRDAQTQAALWSGVTDGLFDVISSDHCPFRFDTSGKLARSQDPSFEEVPNGLPGIEARLPLLFSSGVSDGRLSIHDFVAMSSTNAAKLNGLYPRKGAIVVGADADLAIWDPARRVRLSADLLHDSAGYTPYEGHEVQGWPVTVVNRGRVIVDDDQFHGHPGQGDLQLTDPSLREPAPELAA